MRTWEVTSAYREFGGLGECGVPPGVGCGGSGNSARTVLQHGWLSLLLTLTGMATSWTWLSHMGSISK